MLDSPILTDLDGAAAEAAAIAVARADPRPISHAAMRTWLLRLAAGERDAPRRNPI